MRETSQTIHRWGRETFGEARSVRTYALRAREELEELIEAIEKDESSESILAEAADVTILLHRLAASLNSDLSDAVDQKMGMNRRRTWTKSGDGVGQHKAE
ncbi:nucleotide pyrophosphohydrolase [Litorimonas sp.]|uniref:nucleotide pyrophosphohydrolase n=1 Tax=Litorimonas sp. TaxID=1892381 RepID=UPI003A873E88